MQMVEENILAKINYLLENGIQQETTTPHSSAQNGIAEQLNRTLVEHARAMLHHHQLPNSFWKEAVAYATYLKNRSPTHALKDHKVLDEVFWGKKPDVSHLEEFGKKCWVLQQNEEISKLDPKSKQFIFVGIGDGTKGYRYYNPKTHQTLTSRNVIFKTQIGKMDEVEVSHTVPIEGESGDSNRKVEMETENTQKQKQSLMPVPREKSARILAQPLLNYRVLNDPSARGPKEWQHHVPTTEENGHISVDYAMIGASLEDDPTSLKEAKARSDWPKWKEAMDAEIDQLTKRGTYKMVDLPPDRKAIASKWVFHIKRDHNGKIVIHKARLVAKEFSQIPGIDFVETFAPVMRLDTFRLVRALATNLALFSINSCGRHCGSLSQWHITRTYPHGPATGPSRWDGTVLSIN